MNRHPFRWEGLAFGAFFLAVAGNVAIWRADLLTGEEMSYLVSGLLVVVGVVGVVATLTRSRRRPAAAPSTSTSEEETHEAADPQP